MFLLTYLLGIFLQLLSPAGFGKTPVIDSLENRLGFKTWLSKTKTKTCLSKTKTKTQQFQDQDQDLLIQDQDQDFDV